MDGRGIISSVKAESSLLTLQLAAISALPQLFLCSLRHKFHFATAELSQIRKGARSTGGNGGGSGGAGSQLRGSGWVQLIKRVPQLRSG